MQEKAWNSCSKIMMKIKPTLKPIWPKPLGRFFFCFFFIYK